jgi:hypothetical protein
MVIFWSIQELKEDGGSGPVVERRAHLSQMNIQARLRTMLTEKVPVTAGQAMGGLR